MSIIDNIEEKLKELREEGHIISTPLFTISYNCFGDSFILDIPESRKYVFFRAKGIKEDFLWDIGGVYPFEVVMDNDYGAVWMDLEEYAYGASLAQLPSFQKDGKEHVWLEMEEKGVVAVPLENLKIIKGKE